MKEIIEIDEEIYRHAKDGSKDSNDEWNAMRAIANGTPLPKGHGDLKDADKLKHAFIKWSMAVQGYFTDADIASIVYNSPTIIEADKEYETEVITRGNCMMCGKELHEGLFFCKECEAKVKSEDVDETDN